MAKDEPPCQAEACSLQGCLNRNTYTPDKCEAHVIALFKCCQTMYETASGDGKAPGSSTACPKPSVVERRLKRKGSNSSRK
ncbi:hypothetical protein M407DRAFT_121044 [Tulasnella calospora MUT 4182]|uniref:Cx9C motif-containing protein 4, mitochondrial n=1 Tax=Tulasnella calospora MUT 4182 TaxID=1051891 RepID=A0A0C3QC29_9AGAM|nr:hypothetical protein M407DRAFT_121044 [Tulasnella calospora MUT 4182]